MLYCEYVAVERSASGLRQHRPYLNVELTHQQAFIGINAVCINNYTFIAIPFPTKPCFVAMQSGWDPEALKHPAMAFMRGFTTEWCETKAAQAKPYTDWFTSDFELGTSDGRRIRGKDGANAFIAATRHYSSSTVEIDACYLEETTEGYSGLAKGKIYINFVVPGAKNCEDSTGKEWEVWVCDPGCVSAAHCLVE